MLPNFLIVGAQKAGTTSLWLLLDQHPDVFLARPRETRFFFDDLLWAQGEATYERRFFSDWNGERAVGEKTPEYLLLPEIPERIAAALGRDVRILVTVRSPARRAFSHWRHNHQMLWEPLPFREALEREAERSARGRVPGTMFGYAERGRYAGQIARYRDTFSPENVLVLVFEEEIARDQPETARRLFAFLGVDPDFAPRTPVSAGRAKVPEVDPHGEDRIDFRFPDGRRSTVRSPSPALSRFVRRACESRPTPQAALSREEELELNGELFSEDILKLETLLGRDLGHWLAGKGSAEDGRPFSSIHPRSR